MCKHVAAVLYGVGARLDSQPELIFALRRVDPKDLVAQAGAGLRRTRQGPTTGKVLDDAHLADVFGIEMADVAPAKKPAAPRHVSTATGMKTAPAKVATTVAAGATRNATTAGKTGAAKAAVAQKAAMAKVPAKKSSNTPNRISKARLATMIEAATVDAYGESEQTTGWYTMLEEHLALPLVTTVLGVLVKVARLDLRGDNDIVAICTCGRKRQPVSILDLPLPSPKPVGAEWIEAYRHWVGG
jgi:hypothetical protein